jgi:hypothetical protein
VHESFDARASWGAACLRQAGKQRPYPSEKCSSRTVLKDANLIAARDAESLLGGGRRAQIAEGPETERFQDTVLVFVH